MQASGNFAVEYEQGGGSVYGGHGCQGFFPASPDYKKDRRAPCDHPKGGFSIFPKAEQEKENPSFLHFAIRWIALLPFWIFVED